MYATVEYLNMRWDYGLCVRDWISPFGLEPTPLEKLKRGYCVGKKPGSKAGARTSRVRGLKIKCMEGFRKTSASKNWGKNALVVYASMSSV